LLLFVAPWVRSDLDLRLLGLVYLVSLIATLGFYYQTRASRHSDISYYAPLQNLSPVALFFMAFLFLHETVTTIQFLGILALVVGSYTVAAEGATSFLDPIKKVTSDNWINILASVVFLAAAAAFDKYMLVYIEPLTYLFFAWLFMSINYIILDYYLYNWDHIIVDFQKGWHWLFLCALFSLVSMWVFYEALRLPGVLVSLALPLRRVSALLETVFGGALFHEQNLVRRVFACLIMLVGIVLLTI
jgi:drug/metabolite transporter (DMT)-like permease